ncbi:MAG: DUF4390 domain-containing protein [Candidatus Marinimicrobia bacterium]|nr:DUF4390 domain-containing protein [Candidatus Neomarinimicrobiota bacterium]MBL7109991.1 DUF4390 domain-containing protein [Candidatus Neomarinimicrobiota bacterium]
MEGGIFTELARTITGSIIAIGSMFFSYINGVEPYFESPSFSVEHNQMLVSVNLQNWFTDELDDIFSSGKPIRMHFTANIIEQNSGKTIQSTDFFHTVKYHILDDYFEVSRSEIGEKTQIHTIQEMHRIMSKIERAPIFDDDLAKTDVLYQLKMSVQLPKIKIGGREKQFDLMPFWKNKKPYFFSQQFDNLVFVQ